MTRILVTGGNGQVGRSIAELSSNKLFAHLAIDVVDRAACDITDPAAVRAVVEQLRPNVVINAAAYTAVDAAESHPAAATAANADAVATLAATCNDSRVRLLHLSSDYVFDGTKNGWYVESDPIAPLGAYGRSKAAGEAAARTCDEHLILRTAWVYGSHGNNFVKTMLKVGRERRELRVVADQVGCPSSAHDIAFALLQLVDIDVAGTFHLAGAEEASWYGFASAIFEQAGIEVDMQPCRTTDYPTPAQRPANSRLDSRALADATGIALPGYQASLPTVVEKIASKNRTGSST